MIITLTRMGTAGNYANKCNTRDNPETTSTCNVGFALRFCATRQHVLRDRLFEHIDPHPGFRTRLTNLAKSR